MADEPPWEWVEGDPVLSRRSWWATLASAAVAVSLFALLVLELAGLLAYSPFWTLYFLGLLLVGALSFILRYYVARRFPVVARLGLSPLGVRFESGFPQRASAWNWTEVKGVGPDWVAVSSGGLWWLRYRLTAVQAERLSHFLGPRIRGSPTA